MNTDVTANQPHKTILLVSVATLFGGAESYYVKLAAILLAEFHVVAVVCNQRLCDELRALGIEVELAGAGIHLSGLRRYVATLLSCVRMKRRFNPRVAHLNGQPESYLVFFLRMLGMSLLSTRHTPFTDLYLREGSRLPVFLKRQMVLISLRFCRCTICVSQLLKRQLSDYIDPGKLVYLPTWVSDDFLENYQRPDPSVPLKALFVGRVVRNKGIFAIIEAVRQCSGIQLIVVGEGEDLQAAKEQAFGLSVHFAGFQRDCKPMYRAADLLLFPSPEGFEGLPQVPLEAMAMGVPCLAADISSILEIAVEDGAVATYRQGDNDDLVARLNHFVQDATTLLTLGKAGRLEVERRFTVSAVADGYLQLFRMAQP
jgi:glycosyltransferase involved in cell wall biosynthesis